MGCQYLLLFAIDSLSQCFLHALPTCYLSCHASSRRAASLPDFRADSRPHPYRFPVCLRRRPSLPCSCPPIARSRISTPVAASFNSVYIASRHPFRIAVPILRRLDRLVAWLRDGREGQAWHVRSERIGTAQDGARRIYQMPYRMSVPAGHRGSGYPILILRHGKWAGCGMRFETSIGCDIEHAGISRSPPKFHPM